MKLVAYFRVSSETQLDGFGLDVQAATVREWAKANGHRITQTCLDEALSGAMDPAERPGLACALDALAEGAAQGLVVARLDRLARSLAVQEAALATAWRLGAVVYAVDGGEVLEDDPDDPMRTAMRQMRGVFAQLDRGQVVKRLRDGRKAKAALGRKAVGAYPYGYRGHGSGRERDSAPDAVEQAAVRRIIDMRRAGASFRVIANTLDAEGHRPRRAGSWSPMAVRNVAIREGAAQPLNA